MTTNLPQYPSYNPLTGNWVPTNTVLPGQYNMAIGQQGLQGMVGNQNVAIGIAPHILPGTSNSNVNVYGHSMYLPHPTGIMVSIALYQYGGQYIPVTIDQAYVQIIQDINQLSQNLPRQFSQPVPKRPQHQFMPEGDFSLDEMSRAEEILAELN